MAFLIPGVERILALRRTNPYAGVQMLIVAPTRELAEQIYREASLLTQQHEFLSVQVIYGGLPKGRDISRFQTKIPEILITTPGRILDHLDSTIIDDVPFQECLSQTSLLVLDEMDRLLDMGFFKDISDILKFLPTQENRQTLLFSATIPTTVKSMMDACVRPSNHVFVDCIVEDDPTTHTNASIEQSYVLLPPDRLVSGIAELIQNICKTTDDAKILVFFPTTAQVQFYTSLFTNLGHRVLQIHSKMTQAMRMNMSDQFRWARKGILFTTDITSRGIHYDNVSHVIQVGVANNRSTYVHRVGRTSRMQKTGHGLLVLIDLELEYLKQDLKGLDIRPNHRLQGLLDGPVPTSLQDDLMRIQHEMQNGQAEELAESATNVYTSILGYYSNRLRSLGVRSPDLLVEMINAFANQAGLVELPAISSKLARQNGLFGHSRIHVDARWTPGSTFQVGKQGKKER
jgi:ATP-dependent RNA helicase MSS116